MSMKVNGYQLKVKDNQELTTFLNSLREKLQNQKKHLIIKQASMLCSKYLDSINKNDLDKKEIPFNYAMKTILENEDEIKKTNTRNPYFDFNFELVVFFHELKFYAIAFSESGMLSCFEECPEVSEFHYHSGTDGSPEVSYKEWKKRGKLWEKIIPSGIPSNHGLIFKPELRDTRYLVDKKDIEEIVENQPSYESRLNEKAKNQALNNYVRENKITDTYEIISLINEIFNNKDLVQKEANKITIKNSYTAKDFLEI